MDILSNLNREINLPKSQHFFLFGARQTGKTTLIREVFGSSKLKEYNLLLSHEYTRLVANPSLFREEISALKNTIKYVFVDEVQRIPALLNEIQFLIDQKTPQTFILTGSSARKLKRGHGNLLAGRAWSYNLYPVTYYELNEAANLTSILSYGTLPNNITAPDILTKNENLRSYVDVYLREEIEAEALSRNIGGFIRFLSSAAQVNGEQLNYTSIAHDVGLSSVTVKEYFKILVDTLIGSLLLPFSHSERKKHKTSPKFYFFDTGVLRSLQKRLTLEVQPKTFEYGNYFETWIINEVIRISSYQRKDLILSFLRTAGGAEVDLIIETPRGKVFGVEIKSKEAPMPSDFEPGFNALKKVAPKAQCFCVCTGKNRRQVGQYEVLPYNEFLKFIREL